ncbi:hypothetical protein HYV86_07760 [Candidatus Woesearchaeota archaeon]|nr:hypothetical protein [Candidatus Woesearchaeota archaeon]
MNASQYLDFVRKQRTTPARNERAYTGSIFDELENYFAYNPHARWLELGCGSYTQAHRRAEENMCAPHDVESLVKRGWTDVTGVDLVPLGKRATGWRFIEGDLLEEETWEEIGLGYDIVSTTHLISFNRQKTVSPGFRPRGMDVFSNEFLPERLLDSSHYFSGVDYLLQKIFGALNNGGLVRINSEHLLRKIGAYFVPEEGFSLSGNEGIDLRYLCAKPWTVPWLVLP